MAPFIMNPSRFAGNTFDLTSLKAWYDFRETTGDLLNHAGGSDTIGTNGDMTTGGTITKTANAWNFSSTDGYAEEATNSYLSATHSALTLNIWVKAASARTCYVASINPFDGNTNNFHAHVFTAGQKDQGVLGVTGSQHISTSTTSYSTSVKQMWTLVYDGSLTGGARQKLYLNGVHEVDASTTPPASFTMTSRFSIAKQGSSGQPFFTGVFYDCSVWERAISAADLVTLYNSGTPLDLS
jgi:hypothetical protein